MRASNISPVDNGVHRKGSSFSDGRFDFAYSVRTEEHGMTDSYESPAAAATRVKNAADILCRQ